MQRRRIRELTNPRLQHAVGNNRRTEISSQHDEQTTLTSLIQESAPSTFGRLSATTSITVPPVDLCARTSPQQGLQPIFGINQSVDSETGDINTSEDDDDGALPRIGYDSDTSGDEDGEVQDARGRKRIRPTGDSSEESRDILGNAYSIMRRHYTGPWTCWSKVPDEQIEFWWEEFKNRFFWKDKHAQHVRKNWSAKCSQYLRSKFSEARGTRTNCSKRPDFIDPKIWEAMVNEWKQSESFQRQSEVNKRSRASEAPNGIGIYTAGSKPVVQIVADYERKHGKRMSQEMLMKLTYKKKNGEWSSARPRVALERYKVLCESYLESHPEGIPQDVVDRLWLEAVGGKKKRRAFALGSLHNPVPNSRNPVAIDPLHALRASTLNGNQMEELEKSIEERLKKKMEEEFEKTMEQRIQLQLNKQRQEDGAVFQRMLDIQLSRYVHPTPQSFTSFPPLLNSTAQLYASPTTTTTHPTSIMNTSSLASQPTLMEQLLSMSPSIDASFISTSQPGPTTYVPAAGLLAGRDSAIGGQHTS